MVEVLIALSILSLAVVGIVKLITVSVSSLNYSGSYGRATALAQKEIGRITDLRNTSPNTFFQTYPVTEYFPLDSVYCLKSVRNISDKLNTLIPTDSPRFLSSKMFLITVEVYWGWKSPDNISCVIDTNLQNFQHSIKVGTYLAN